jgi:hypothetical protein
MKIHSVLKFLTGTLLMALACLASSQAAQFPDWTRIGLTQETREPAYWLERAPLAETVLISPQTITDRNERLLKIEPTMVSWPDWPESLGAEDIRKRIQALSRRPESALFVNSEKAVTDIEINAWMENLNLSEIQASDNRLFGLVVARAPLRKFPTDMRVFERQGSLDIDRLQESALFPGTPVAVLHESKDRKWLFVQAENYAAWVNSDRIGIATRKEVLAYALKKPRLYVTGSQVRTVFHPYAKYISELALDMGSSYPLRTDWPLSKPVNDQGSLGAWIIELPLRSQSGILHIKPVLVPHSADVALSPLAASQANVIKQSLKFQGERYGWGHDYNGRDCSGFVSEVYRSMGILLPRNTSDQQRSTAFERIVFDAGLNRQQRMEMLKKLHIGDLVFIPGHVMMVIGQDAQGPWVIHDTHRTNVIIDGRFHNLPSNSVVVTPLLPLALSGERLYVDAVTAVQRILPSKP